MMWGMPTCINREAKYWVVAWVLPKIMGGLDFKGTLDRNLNITNASMIAFRHNVSRSLADCLTGVHFSHFISLKVSHMWESGNLLKDNPVDDADKFEDYQEHLFSVTYVLLIWDVNTLGGNEELLNDLLKCG